MIDPEMTKILENLNSAADESTASTTSKKGTDPMLAILEGFDNAAKGISEGGEGPGAKFKKQMPGTHKMGSMSSPIKNDQKHPASEYLVGGEEGEPDAGEEVISEEPVEEETIAPKQSFSDILRSIEEVNNERLNRAKGEVQVKEKKKLTQNDKGTYDLAEDEINWNDPYAIQEQILMKMDSMRDVIDDMHLSLAGPKAVKAMEGFYNFLVAVEQKVKKLNNMLGTEREWEI